MTRLRAVDPRLAIVRVPYTCAGQAGDQRAVVNLMASYAIATQHVAHLFGVNFFNAGDRLYRNHLSFIKSVAPEIGRGVRISYTLNWF